MRKMKERQEYIGERNEEIILKKKDRLKKLMKPILIKSKKKIIKKLCRNKKGKKDKK